MCFLLQVSGNSSLCSVVTSVVYGCDGKIPYPCYKILYVLSTLRLHLICRTVRFGVTTLCTLCIGSSVNWFSLYPFVLIRDPSCPVWFCICEGVYYFFQAFYTFYLQVSGKNIAFFLNSQVCNTTNAIFFTETHTHTRIYSFILNY